MTTLGEFRRITVSLPDETEMFCEDDEALQFAEVNLMTNLNPTGALPGEIDHPPALLMTRGQVWNYERDLDRRIDIALGMFEDDGDREN